MKPTITCGLTADGDIEAVCGVFHPYQRLVIDRRTGTVLETNVREGTDFFRWLVTEARTHVNRGVS